MVCAAAPKECLKIRRFGERSRTIEKSIKLVSEEAASAVS
jgi:hypothetical protein